MGQILAQYLQIMPETEYDIVSYVILIILVTCLKYIYQSYSDQC